MIPTRRTDRLRRLSIRESRFRRLDSRRQEPERGFKSDRTHPIRAVFEPRDGAPFRVALHVSSFVTDDREGALAVEILRDMPLEVFEVIRTAGLDPLSWPVLPTIEMRETSDDVLPVVLKMPTYETHTGILRPDQWRAIAQNVLKNPALGDELLLLKAAEELNSHLFVTGSPSLLRARNTMPRLTELVFSPLEAVPLLWAWSRARGDHWDGRIVTASESYYWALARALTPAAFPGFAALVRGENAIAPTHDVVALGQSGLRRLASMAGAIDSMFLAWQLPTDNFSLDRIAQLFDHVVLSGSAVLDNMALLAARVFGLTTPPNDVSLVNTNFRTSLTASPDRRAIALADYLTANVHAVDLHLELRHHAIHRAQLQGIRLGRQGAAEETRLWVTEPSLSKIWQSIRRLGQSPTSWGFHDRQGPHEETTNFVDAPERSFRRMNPGQALLDPMRFAPRFLAHVARVVDDIFRLLDLPQDPRFTEVDRRWIADLKREWPFRDTDRPKLILTSPLSGLVQT